MAFLRSLSVWVTRWPIALATVLVLGAVVLLPGLGRSGLWEPQERQLSDRIAPHESVAPKPAEPPRPEPACERAIPKDATARSLTTRAVVFGRDRIADSDAGRKLPLALLGLLTVLATAGLAMRAAGARAGIVTAAVVLAMPLLGLQARMLTSEIGTPCGAALIVYGLYAIVRPVRGRWLVMDLLLSVAALGAGLVIGFYGGGALLGLVVPIGAVAAAGGLGAGLVIAAIRRRPAREIVEQVPAALATLAVAGLIGVLAYQLYELRDPIGGITPPARQVLGNAIVPDGCYSSLLGAIWRPEDDLRFIYDSTFEQIGYGTFPWGILAPVALCFLLRDDDPRRRVLGAIALAWAGGAWIANEAFHRKVGFTIWAGFPAVAVAVGVWFDGVLARRAIGDPRAMPAGALLVALYALLGVLNLGKDMQSFPDKLASLVSGTDLVTYPTATSIKLGVLGLGMIVALGFAIAMAWRAGEHKLDHQLRRVANVAAAVAIAATIFLAAFWTFGWHAKLALHLSSKTMFDTYHTLRAPPVEGGHSRDPLLIMGDLGQAPRFYTPQQPELVQTRDQVVKSLQRTDARVFAIMPRTDLCTLHREMGDKPYFVVEDRNAKNLLFSNRVDGTTDKNSLARVILHHEPKTIAQRPKGTITWDNKIQLLGWDLPRAVDRGSRFQVTLYYKVLTPVGGGWKTLVHFDPVGGSTRIGGDHDPINGLCPTGSWMQGDYIVDTFEITAGGGGHFKGPYALWIGFFTGTAPNWKNMTVKSTSEQRDEVDRVKIASVIVQ
ncbi:MAG: hypothetical protein WKG01_15355 [Kofleriaceae bacterium]